MSIVGKYKELPHTLRTGIAFSIGYGLLHLPLLFLIGTTFCEPAANMFYSHCVIFMLPLFPSMFALAIIWHVPIMGPALVEYSRKSSESYLFVSIVISLLLAFLFGLFVGKLTEKNTYD